jgi:hypothetical protein
LCRNFRAGWRDQHNLKPTIIARPQLQFLVLAAVMFEYNDLLGRRLGLVFGAALAAIVPEPRIQVILMTQHRIAIGLIQVMNKGSVAGSEIAVVVLVGQTL